MTLGFIFFAVIIVTLVVVATRLTRARSPQRRSTSRHATVVLDIVAGGFGQIRLADSEPAVLLAARSASGESLPAGTAVEIVDDSRSVVLVRPLPERE